MSAITCDSILLLPEILDNAHEFFPAEFHPQEELVLHFFTPQTDSRSFSKTHLRYAPQKPSPRNEDN